MLLVRTVDDVVSLVEVRSKPSMTKFADRKRLTAGHPEAVVLNPLEQLNVTLPYRSKRWVDKVTELVSVRKSDVELVSGGVPDWAAVLKMWTNNCLVECHNDFGVLMG